MRTVQIDLDETLPIGTFDLDVATGVTTMDGVEVRLIHVLAAREYTIPVKIETSAEDALRLAAAVIEWDVGAMEQADSPFLAKGPKVSARQVIRSFLSAMYRCEFRDLFVDMYQYAGGLR